MILVLKFYLLKTLVGYAMPYSFSVSFVTSTENYCSIPSGILFCCPSFKNVKAMYFKHQVFLLKLMSFCEFQWWEVSHLFLYSEFLITKAYNTGEQLSVTNIIVIIYRTTYYKLLNFRILNTKTIVNSPYLNKEMWFF